MIRVVDQLIREDEAVRVLELILDTLEVPNWFRKKYSETLQTHINPPKALEELHEDVHRRMPGTQVHHIVEQGSAYQDGFPRSAIDASDNLVRIPIVRHEEITAWFNTRNPRFGGRKPRDYQFEVLKR